MNYTVPISFLMSGPRYRAITLDLWDTLVQEVPRKNPSLAKIRVEEMRSKLGAFGYEYGTDALDRAYKLSGDFCDEIWERDRDIPTDEHLLFMLKCIDPQLAPRLKREEYAGLRKIYAEALLRFPPVLMEGALPLLEAASDRGYSIGLISNTGRTPGSVLRIILNELGIGAFFDCMTFSDEELVRKPESGIFLSALRGIGACPSEAVHIGNDPEDDFDGAKRAGMNAILLDRSGSVKKSGETVHSLSELVDLI